MTTFETVVDEFTFNELGSEMLSRLYEQRAGLTPADAAAGRDLSLSITHLEDALTRFNSAQYHLLGTWKRSDPEKMV